MTDKKLTINENYWTNFSKVYKNPSLVNDYLKEHSDNVEQVIVLNFKELGLEEDYSIYANGGFGRKEMFPSSDVDISIITNKTRVKSTENLEKFIARLWDLGFQVGHSVRSLNDIRMVSATDTKEYTSYLTRRSLISTPKIDKKINDVLKKSWSKKKFFKAKIDEQEQRYLSFFSTEYNLEPDLKESPGTLRDFQTALWILQHCFDLKTFEAVRK